MSLSPIRVAGISGSLRRGSLNSAALRAAQALAPEGMTIEIAEIGDMPHYNEDLRAGGYPAPVERFRAQLAAADAILFVTPEYNYSIPGVLKNAIDWGSRPPEQPFNDKPVAIMGASGGLLGTARAQYQLRQMLVFLNAHPINKPEVMIGQAPSKFDEAGNLTDETTKKFIGDLLTSLAAWTRRLKAPAMAAE
ncbi:NADPH-dependent FMN reductase [Salinarimonas soli]|uniref:NAD(P)H-dependent oxidoreductase n=1 Tax=Salinarimonas soli TaxID=1638099 RepID=A0A5B2W090_9HYPH|nr:NAD(P)H-dependent oxidoreductase [Salinarimonas soli]KAA2244002.1 NAD(P)H-dependent oxidoreductase [Salinarimonas soli]